MITLNSIENTNIPTLTIIGLSKDNKPVDEVENRVITNGSVFEEIDTGNTYLFDYQNKVWVQQKSNEGNFEILEKLNQKVDKVSGKGLSSNDFTNELKQKLDDIDLSEYAKKSEVNDSLNNKVNKVEGKDLSTNDFTNEYKQIIDGLNLNNQSDILGLCVDYENKTFARLAGATNLTAGTDFDKFPMYGNRKRCNVLDDGTITAYYGDENYTEDGSNGQVMVYQPKFYYKVVPLKLEPIDTGIGYHLRKANYYISAYPYEGFKLHPAFYDGNKNEVDYVLIGAYEGSIYDTSESSYLLHDEQVMAVGEDKFCSIAGVKPASGFTQNLTRPNVETLAQNRGSNWHGSTIKIASMNQLLCMIEMGTMNFQSAIGQGVVSYASGNGNEASNTGATSSLGNGTGQATQTTHISSDGTETIDTTSGKLSVSYRGLENPWGNIWEFEYGVNIWGNGNMAGGQPYVADDFNFAESKRTDNYEGAGFTVAHVGGYISAMGYSTRCDWLFMASETAGNSSLPVGDLTYVTPNLNEYRIVRLGGGWNERTGAGGFCWVLHTGVGWHIQYLGGRLVYVPTATVI